MSGTNWLDLSLSSNRHIRTYVQGFVDISGGNLIVRNNNLFVYGGDSSLNGRLLVSGDSSLNGNLTIGSTLYPTGGINLQNNLNMGGLINQSGTTVQGGVIYQPIVTSDVSAIINASNMYVNNMIQSDSKFIIGNANTSVVIGVSGNPLTVSGPLFALYDASINGRLFVTKDVSLNGNLFVNADVSLNSRLFVGGDASLNSRVFIGGDVSMNGRLYVGGDASLNSRVFIGGDVSLNGRLYVGGDVSLNSRVFIGGDVSLNGNLFVNSDVSLNSRLFINSDLSMNGNLTLGKDLLVNGNLSVKQYSTNLTVYTVAYNNFTVAEDMSLNGRLYLTGDASMNTRLFVGGDVSLNSRLFIGGDASLNSRLFIGGDVSLNSRLFINSDLSMNGNLTLGKDLLVNGNLSVKQYSTNLTVYTVAYNNFTVAEDMSLNGRLYLTGDASMNTRLFVGGDVSFNGKGYVAGNLNVGGTVTTTGNVGIGTTNPGYPLEIKGPGTIAGVSAYPYVGQLTLRTLTNSGTQKLVIGSYSTSGVGLGSYLQSSDEYSGAEHPTNISLNPNGGNVGIGTTNPLVALSVGGHISAAGICTVGYNSISYFGGNYTQNMNRPSIHINSPDTYIRYPITFGSGSMAHGTSTFTNGTIYGSITTNNLNTQFNTSSDYRLKENVVDLSNCLYVVTKLKPRQFNFIECPDAIQNGFIAHEVQEFVPNAVIHNKDEVDASGNIVTQQLDASKLIPFLVGAIQDLESKLASIEARLATAGF